MVKAYTVRRTAAIALVIFMLLQLLPFGILTAEALDSYSPGDSVYVEIHINGNTDGQTVFMPTIEYDTDVLLFQGADDEYTSETLDSCVQGGALFDSNDLILPDWTYFYESDSFESVSSGVFELGGGFLGNATIAEENFTTPIQGNGHLITLRFIIKDNVTDGVYENIIKSVTENPDNWDDNGPFNGAYTWSPATITVADNSGNTNPGGNQGEITVASGYGGAHSNAGGVYTFTPDTGYKLDVIYVDGVSYKPAEVFGKTSCVIDTADAAFEDVKSIVATYAYTVNFNTPANGSLSVVRVDGDVVLKSEDIVRGGELLRITAAPADGYKLDGGLALVGLTRIGDTDTYTVTAKRDEATPSVNATFTEDAAAPPTVLPIDDTAVSAEAELRYIAEAVNSGNDCAGLTLTLENDITLTEQWIPIGTQANPFRGSFDGQGFTVSGLNVLFDGSTQYLGLFGYARNATIKNLTVEGRVDADNASIVSGASATPYAGGIAGMVLDSGDGQRSVIEKCVNRADVIVSYGSAGGMVGQFYGAEIKDCLNYGAVSVTKRNTEASPGGNGCHAGGIAGYLGPIGGPLNMLRCGNYGAVSLNGTTWINAGEHEGASYAYYNDHAAGSAGGLAGWASPRSNQAVVIENGFNKGAVTGWAQYTGGLLGFESNDNGTLTLKDSYNTGSVSMTADNNNGNRAYVAGLVGAATKGGGLYLERSYNAGEVKNLALDGYGAIGELCAVAADRGSGTDGAAPVVASCYGSDETPDISILGAGFQADANGINGGRPLLSWEDASANGETRSVSFDLTPQNAEVRVFTDPVRQSEVTGVDGAFELGMGGPYYYTVSAPGFVTERGSFNVLYSDLTQTVSLREAASVTLTVAPADAALTMKGGTGLTVEPAGVQQGSQSSEYTFILYANELCSYSISAPGRNGTTREFVATDGLRIDEALSYANPGDKDIQGGQTISAGGVYNVTRQAGDTQGMITISTPDPVTLVGTGTGASDAYERLFVKYTVDHADLTLRDIYITNNDTPRESNANLINFMGSGNNLRFQGVSILDMNTNATGYAMIHVNSSTELTVGGVSSSDTLYFYKREQGAGIGGNGDASGNEGQAPEYNGKITITGGNLFMKNSKQGALLGAGADANSAVYTPGDIIILGGTLNLIAESRGAAIGGSAGSSGGSAGSDFYIHENASVNINIDYSGSAIGGGGYESGNQAAGGTLHYLGGSVRTFIDRNAVDEGLWPVTTPSVNDIAITANKTDGNGSKVYLLTFDTRALGVPSSVFEVKDVKGGEETLIYRGGAHKYKYINETLYKDDQKNVNYTIDNWVPLDDPNLYLYLTGENHTLTVNGESFTVLWNSRTGSFETASGLWQHAVVDSNITGGAVYLDRSEFAAGESVAVRPVPEAGNRLAAGSLTANGQAVAQTNGVYGFTMPSGSVILTAVFEPIPQDAPRSSVHIAQDVTGGRLIPDKDTATSGEAITIIVRPDAGKELVPDSLTVNGVRIPSVGGFYSFIMQDTDVTLSASFADVSVSAPNGTRFKTGSAQDMALVIEKDFKLFDKAEGLSLGSGSKLPLSAYEVTEGSTIVTVFNEYLNTLTEGNYILRVPFTDGSVIEQPFLIADRLFFSIAQDASVVGGLLTPSPATAEEGDVVTVAVQALQGYRLVQGSLAADVGRTINADANGAYTFIMPAWDVTLYADFIETGTSVTPPEQGAEDDAFKEGIKGTGDIYAGVWDGKSLDLRWFDPDKGTYTINTPAELAGLAALVNGLYNREIDTVAGKMSYIHVNTALGDGEGPLGNNKSTPTYHYGDYNFAGKTVYLGRDIDMGRNNNYMPIGGQYLMTPNRSETHIGSSFNGVFDGRGHSVTIYTDRHCSTGNYGDGESVGLIGRLGVHDQDPDSLRAEGLAVKNVAVYGSVKANRSVGGVVGKIGKTSGGATIENCANFASISSTDAKGIGGIVGAAWNGGVIRNCYNAGTVSGTHTNPAGGIGGSVEIPIENSYNYGNISAPKGYALSLGTNNGGAPVPTDSYYLEKTAADGGWYTGSIFDNSGERTSDYMKSDEFVTLLGSGFVKDTNNINKGYPVLRWQGGSAVSPPQAAPEDGSKPTVSVPSTTTVKDGEAITVVDAPDKDNPIGGGEASRLVVSVDTGGESVSKITAEMPAEFVKQASESKSDIEIRSEVANVLLPEKAVAELAAGGKDISVKAEKAETANTYIFTVESGGKALPAVDGGIKAAIPAKDASSGTVAVLVHSDGTSEIIKKSVIIEDDLLVPLSGSATIRIEDRSKSFSDVTEGSWYADAVSFVTGRELFTGTSETEFSPNASMTRAMLVTVLYRLENEPAATGESFSDVSADKYYANAAAWASENGIVTGL
jgi:hypothetical protein